MEPGLQLLLMVRLVATAVAWAIWWSRRGQSRLLVCRALSVWSLLALIAVARGASPELIFAIDSAGVLWLALAIWSRRRPATGLRPHQPADDKDQAIEENSRLVRILEASPDLVATYDPEGSLSYMNPAGLELLGFESPPKGLNIVRLLPKATRERVHEEIFPEVLRHDVWVGEAPLLRTDGEEVPTRQAVLAHRSATGDIEMYSTLAHSIADRLKAENALRESEARFAAAFEHSLDSVILTAVPSGKVLDVNRGFTTITGFSREQAIGRTTLEMGLWARLEDRDRMMTALRQEGRVEKLEADFQRRQSGEVIHGLLWGELVDVRGQSCLLTVVRDVTEPRRQERERAGFVAELERKNRELERFASTVAHDLRNPLQSIQGIVELAELDLADSRPKELPEHLARIRGGAERLQELTESLLELSRAGKVIEQRRPVALTPLAHEAVELLAASVRRTGAEISVSENLPSVMGDATRLLQVMQNLLSNALCSLSVNGLGGRIDIGRCDRSDEGRPVLFIRDDGVGIEEQHLDDIFHLFHRGAARGEGSGIGLALVDKIVSVHGGRVWAESAGSGQGATFFVALPEA